MMEITNIKDELVANVLNDVYKCLGSILNCLGADGSRFRCYTKRIESNIDKLKTMIDYEKRATKNS